MGYCKRCGVSLRGKMQVCPLCLGQASGQPGEQDPAFPKLPDSREGHGRLLAWSGFVSLVAAAVCTCVNLLLPGGGWWFWFVLAGLGSLWVTLAILLKKRRNPPKSVVWQVGVISALAWLWDRYTGFHGWSVDYVFPILSACGLLAIAVFARLGRLRLQDYILYLVLGCFLGIVSFVFLALGVVRVVLPSAISFCMAAIFLAALLVFRGRYLWAEVQRRLHF